MRHRSAKRGIKGFVLIVCILTLCSLPSTGNSNVTDQHSIHISGTMASALSAIFTVTYATTKDSFFCRKRNILAGVSSQKTERFHYKIAVTEQAEKNYSIELPLNALSVDTYCAWRVSGLSVQVSHQSVPHDGSTTEHYIGTFDGKGRITPDTRTVTCIKQQHDLPHTKAAYLVCKVTQSHAKQNASGSQQIHVNFEEKFEQPTTRQ